MAITAASLFGPTQTASVALWKSPAPSQPDGAWKAKTPAKTSGGLEDSVEISSLGSALKGVAADVFAALGSKAREKLEDLVKSNKVTADEVSLGLRSMATSSLYERFSGERERDDEDMALRAKSTALTTAATRRAERTASVEERLSQLQRPMGGTSESSDVILEKRNRERVTLETELEVIRKEEIDAVGGDPAQVRRSLEKAFKDKSEAAFKNADFGETGDDGFLALDDKKGEAAARRLVDLGFTPKLYGNGLSKFTAGVDIPGVGKGTYKENVFLEPAAAAAPPPEDIVGGGAAKMLDQAAKAVAQAAASKGLPGAGKIAKDARVTLDGNYQAMSSSGKPYDASETGDRRTEAAFAGLDRRSLFAVASNGGGLFSEAEQKAAQALMARQQAEAMRAADPTGTDKAAGFKAAVAFLDGVSDEEKASANWSVQRAANQLAYENLMRAQDKPSTVADSASPVVRMIKSAMEAKQGESFTAMVGAGYVKDLAAMPLFRNGIPKIDGCMPLPVNVRV